MDFIKECFTSFKNEMKVLDVKYLFLTVQLYDEVGKQAYSISKVNSFSTLTKTDTKWLRMLSKGLDHYLRY